MKKEMNHYVSPVIKEILIHVEGMLCESNVGSSHDGYSHGGDIDFVG